MAIPAQRTTWFERIRPSGPAAWWAWASLGVLPAVVFILGVTVGLRPEHFFFAMLFLVLAWVGPRARRFSILSAPFVVVGLSYDLLRLFTSHRGQIHTGDLFDAERALFGVTTPDGVVAVSDVIARATHPALDLVTGLVYLVYLLQVFAAAALFYVRGEEQRMQRLAFSFALCNAIGWTVWLAWPAAPPWYIDIYGGGPAVEHAIPSPAGAARFDALLGAGVFSSFYARSSNVFGAMPSLHMAYAILTASAMWGFGPRMRVVALSYAVAIAFAAVYLRHHYLLDVIAGVLVGFVADGAVVAAQRGLGRLAPEREPAGVSA
jgi:membrane-associated phospholipid phosphatase